MYDAPVHCSILFACRHLRRSTWRWRKSSVCRAIEPMWTAARSPSVTLWARPAHESLHTSCTNFGFVFEFDYSYFCIYCTPYCCLQIFPGSLKDRICLFLMERFNRFRLFDFWTGLTDRLLMADCFTSAANVLILNHMFIIRTPKFFLKFQPYFLFSNIV